VQVTVRLNGVTAARGHPNRLSWEIVSMGPVGGKRKADEHVDEGVLKRLKTLEEIVVELRTEISAMKRGAPPRAPTCTPADILAKKQVVLAKRAAGKGVKPPPTAPPATGSSRGARFDNQKDVDFLRGNAGTPKVQLRERERRASKHAPPAPKAAPPRWLAALANVASDQAPPDEYGGGIDDAALMAMEMPTTLPVAPPPVRATV
jgi:hypothetical protein